MTGFYLIIGKQGAGKTLMATKLIFESDKKRVFSNYELFGREYTPITLNPDVIKDPNKKYIYVLDKLDEDPDFFNGSLMAIDELHLDLDSLDFMKKNNRRLQKFFSQLRKRKILLIATTQYIMNVDIRIRRQCMNVLEMSKVTRSVFNVITHDIDGYFTTPISSYSIDLKEHYEHYNTFEIIS